MQCKSQSKFTKKYKEIIFESFFFVHEYIICNKTKNMH